MTDTELFDTADDRSAPLQKHALSAVAGAPTVLSAAAGVPTGLSIAVGAPHSTFEDCCLVSEAGPPRTRTTLPWGVGIQDAGASASAGSTTAVQGLLGALMRQDPRCRIVVTETGMPWFRFGNGE